MRPLSPATTSAPTRRSSTSEVGADARSLLREQGVADRVVIAEGSFFDSVPGDGDVYLLKNIIHDWPDEKAVQILRNVRAAGGSRATVLLVEFVIPKHNR